MKAWIAAIAWAVSAVATNASAATFHRPVRTDDGVTLALYRYVPTLPSRRPAVLLVPGLGMNRHAFDLDGYGLAGYLQAHGRDVFVIEPRGTGASDHPVGWHLSDWGAHDLPAAVKAVQAAHPGKLDLVGVGFGGTLVLAATDRELAGKVRRVVALSTPALPEVPNPLLAAILRHHGPLEDLFVEPAGARAFQVLYADHGLFPFSSRNVLDASVFENLGEPASSEWLKWMQTGDLTLADGSRISQRLAQYTEPTLLFLPQLDNVAHPEFAAPLRELAPHADVRLYTLSKLEQMPEDYSHLSMLLGSDAPRDVFAPLLSFLDESDPEAQR